MKSISSKKLLILFCLILSQTICKSQVGITFGLKPGFLMAHQEVMQHLRSHLIGADITIEKDMRHKSWADKYQNPVAQLGLSYYDLRNDLTGQIISLDFRLGFGVFTIKNTEFRLRMGSGLGFATEVYNNQTNRRNQVLGSHLNMKMDFAFLFKSNLPKNYFLEYGLAASHFSNANFKLPNLGYNLPLLMIRTGWLPQSIQPAEYSTEKPLYVVESTFVFTRRQTNISRPEDIIIYGMQVRGIKNKNKVIALRAGIDLMMDKNYAYYKEFEVDQKALTFSDQFELGVAAGASYAVGDLKMITELGAHLVTPQEMKRLFYQRLGFGYDLKGNLLLQATLKFARGKADYMELGLGYRLWQK
jgi:hypothetical protein